MPSQTSSSWALPATLKSTDAAFIGHTFKWAAHSYLDNLMSNKIKDEFEDYKGFLNT
jgi:hypothetical protein